MHIKLIATIAALGISASAASAVEIETKTLDQLYAFIGIINCNFVA